MTKFFKITAIVAEGIASDTIVVPMDFKGMVNAK